MSDSRLRKNLPVRMRQKKTSSGKVYYYYDTCVKPRKWIALGSNYIDAIKKYAELEEQYDVDDLRKRIFDEITVKYVLDRYIREILPLKAPATQKDNLREIGKLLEFFNNPPAPINVIEPVHIRQYLDLRGQTAKTRANREVSLFSHAFNKAREWGYTSNENPCHGVKKFKEEGRDVYVTDELFWKTYGQAERHIQMLMMVAYLIGQRVADCLKIKTTDIRDNELWISQNKVTAKVRIALTGLLKEVIDQVLIERGQCMHDYLFVHLGRGRHFGQPLTHRMLSGGMDRAREKAGVPKEDFQFRDLRAKAATDKDELLGIEAARNLLGHTNQAMTSDYIRHRKGKLVDPTRDDI